MSDGHFWKRIEYSCQYATDLVASTWFCDLAHRRVMKA
jgi:hypothetical protein